MPGGSVLDVRIAQLTSTTFHGQHLVRCHIAAIGETVATLLPSSRYEPAQTICEHPG